MGTGLATDAAHSRPGAGRNASYLESDGMIVGFNL